MGGTVNHPRQQEPVTQSVRWLNDLARQDVIRVLLSACHSGRWAEGVADSRPLMDGQDLLDAADRVWQDLDPADWLEALAGHPRIGESGGTSQKFSATEQAGMRDADAAVRTAIADGNREYEVRFGHVFLISAAGRSPQDILANLQVRLKNTPDAEVTTAAQEHRRITRLRLQKLLAERG